VNSCGDALSAKKGPVQPQEKKKKKSKHLFRQSQKFISTLDFYISPKPSALPMAVIRRSCNRSLDE
jgi:hypothetical protein